MSYLSHNVLSAQIFCGQINAQFTLLNTQFVYFHKLLHFTKYCVLLQGLEECFDILVLSIWYIVYSIYLLWTSQGSEPTVLKVLRRAPYKQPPSRPLRPLQDDNNDGNYADMDTVFAEMMNKL